MATHGDIGVSQPAASTITMKVRTVTLTLNSTAVHQEILTLGGAESSLEVARVMASVPGSTEYGLVVRVADPSTGPIAVSSVGGAVVMRSSAANALVSVYQSTAADLNVTVARVVGNSSAADYMPVRIVDSSGTGYLAPGLEYTDGSTTSTLAAPGLAYNNSSNNTMRLVGTAQPLPVQLVRTFSSRTNVVSTITSTASSAFYELISSAASVMQCVHAYSVTSTVVSPMAVEFLSGTGTVIWALDLGSGSSGVTGANMAVPAPGDIFRTAAAANLNVRLGSTGVQVRIAVSKFTE